MKKISMIFLVLSFFVSFPAVALDRTFQADWSPPVAGENVVSVSVEWLSGTGAVSYDTRTFAPSVVQDIFTRDVNNGDTIKFRVIFHNNAGPSPRLDSNISTVTGNPEPPSAPTSATLQILPLQ